MVETFEVFVGFHGQTASGGSGDGEVIDIPVVAISTTIVAGAGPTETEVEVSLVTASSGEGNTFETADSGVGADIDVADVDFESVPGGTVGAIVDEALVGVEFLVVLIEADIDEVATHSADSGESHESVESASSTSRDLVNHTHEHETIVGGRGIEITGTVEPRTILSLLNQRQNILIEKFFLLLCHHTHDIAEFFQRIQIIASKSV